MSKLKFGDFVIITQKRHGVANEEYLHKVVGTLKSNLYVDVPVQSPALETIHAQSEEVVACICCGVSEREVKNYKISDVSKVIIPVRD